MEQFATSASYYAHRIVGAVSVQKTLLRGMWTRFKRKIRFVHIIWIKLNLISDWGSTNVVLSLYLSCRLAKVRKPAIKSNKNCLPWHRSRPNCTLVTGRKTQKEGEQKIEKYGKRSLSWLKNQCDVEWCLCLCINGRFEAAFVMEIRISVWTFVLEIRETQSKEKTNGSYFHRYSDSGR